MIRVPPGQPAREDFLALLAGSLAQGRFVKLVLARYQGVEAGLNQLALRQVLLRDEACLSLVYRYQTRDVTRNLSIGEGLKLIGERLGSDFRNAHLQTSTEDIQLSISRRGQATLRRSASAHGEATPQPHDREKQRFVELDRPFLTALGVTDVQHRLVPAMARKWKQINKFVEVFSHALAASPLAQAQQIRVADFGSGKGYLTFAIHDHLRHRLKRNAQVTGVELRQDMVSFCNGVVARLGIEGLAFEQGDIGQHATRAIDVMTALHEKFKASGLPHGWSTAPGGHTWEYWALVLPRILEFHLPPQTR